MAGDAGKLYRLSTELMVQAILTTLPLGLPALAPWQFIGLF